MTAEAEGPKALCELCQTWVPLGWVLDHMRDQHPELGLLEMDTWPDGEPVIIDETLEPEDFLKGGKQ